MPPCLMHVNHWPTFHIQFLCDPRISLVSILPMTQPLLPNTGFTRGTKMTHSSLSPSSSEASFPEWLTSTPAVTLMALAQLSPFFSVSASTLTTVVSYVARNVDEIQERKRNFMNIIPSTCFKQFFYCYFLLTVKPKVVYPFPRNSIVPTSQQWRENYCVWNVSRAMECRPVLVSRSLFVEPLGVYHR